LEVDVNSEKDPDLARVKAALETLSEHFESVHIFATRHDGGPDGGTISVQRGVGNWFARRGQITEWLVKRDEEACIEIRKDSEDE
jgi:hypothetical protein